MSPRTGRPHAENPKTERLFVRVTPEEKQAIQDACATFGVTVLDLIHKGIEEIKK